MKSAIPDVTDTEKHAAWALYMGGFEASEIVERMPDLNINTLKSWISISGDGWFREREAINAARREKNPPEKSPIVQVFNPDKKAENIKVFQEKTGEIAAKDAEHWAEGMTAKERLEKAEKIAALSKTHRQNLDLDAEQVGERGLIGLVYLNTPAAVRVVEAPAPKQVEDSES